MEDSSTATPTSPVNSSHHRNMPTEKELRKISKMIITDWKSVCTSLDILDNAISVCVQDNPGNAKDACFAALISWQRNADPSPTWSTLLDAMRENGFRHDADAIDAALLAGGTW